jgi:signal transduction histidine kinase
VTPLFWVDTGSYFISAVLATALVLMVLGAGLRRALNRCFALFVSVEAVWAATSLLLRMALWLGIGNPDLALELGTLSFSLLGPLLLFFTVRYVGRRTLWVDLTAILALIAIVALSVPLFRHQIVLNPRMGQNGIVAFDISDWGPVAGLVPGFCLVAAVVLFWRERRRTAEPYLAVSALILLVGFVVGGLFVSPLPVMSMTTSFSIAVLGYGVISRQILNPLRDRTAQLGALRQVGLELTAQLDVGALLHSIVSRAVELLRGTGGGLYLYRRDRDVLEWSLGIGDSLPPIGITLQRGEGLSGRVWVQDEPLIVNDYEEWEGRAAVHEGLPNVAAAGAPVRWGEEFLGVISVVADVPQTFSPADAELLTLFATQAAIAMRNARLFEAARSRSHYLETLLQINATLRSTLPLREVLETIVRGAGETLGYVGSFIALPDASGGRLNLGAAWGSRFLDAVARFTGFNVEALGLPLEARENPVVRAYLTGELATTTEPEAIVVGVEPTIRPVLAPLISAAMGVRLAACVPLSGGEGIVGVLVVMSPRETLVGEERAMLLGLADQAGLAIENARLYGDLQERMDQLQKTQAQLVQSAKLAAVGELAAGVAHELNNPLAVILGFAELLTEEVDPASPFQEDLTKITAEARRARVIVHNLLDFARQREPQEDLADVNIILRETLAVIRPHLERSGVDVEEEYADVDFLLLDEGQMKQVFLNLISNAIQAMPAGGTLGLRTAHVGDEVVVSITDTGEGIPPEHLQRVFDPFFTTKTSGTGLGLSVSLGIVQAHGGRITVESEPGEGSAFTVWLSTEREGGETT